jgi:hypothetical protein
MSLNILSKIEAKHYARGFYFCYDGHIFDRCFWQAKPIIFLSSAYPSGSRRKVDWMIL